MVEEPKARLIRERLDVCELDRAKMSLLNPQLIEQKKQERTIDETTKILLERTMKEGIETVWDRFEMQQPPCKYCMAGRPVPGVQWDHAGLFPQTGSGGSAVQMQT